MGGRPTVGRLFKPLQYRLANPVKIADHICIADMQDRYAQPVQCRIAFEIRQNIMRVTIHFDDQPLLRTKEIGNEGTDNRLPTKFVTAELRAGQSGP